MYKVNINAVKEHFEKFIAGEEFKTVESKLVTNLKKERDGKVSISIDLTKGYKSSQVVIYILERKGKNDIYTLVVNGKTHSILFDNNSPDSVTKSYDYVERALSNSVKILNGGEISKPDVNSGKELAEEIIKDITDTM